MKNTIEAIITFSQSKTYPTDWKIRTEYKNTKNLLTILIQDEVSKNTRFGEKPDLSKMKEYAKEQGLLTTGEENCQPTRDLGTKLSKLSISYLKTFWRE